MGHHGEETAECWTGSMFHGVQITMPADPEKKALAEKMVADEKARWKAEWQESQRLKKCAVCFLGGQKDGRLLPRAHYCCVSQ